MITQPDLLRELGESDHDEEMNVVYVVMATGARHHLTKVYSDPDAGGYVIEIDNEPIQVDEHLEENKP